MNKWRLRSHQVHSALNNSCRASCIRYIHAFSLSVQHFRDGAVLSRDARRRGALALVGDLCARRYDTPFIATRKSIERPSPRASQPRIDAKREKERGKEEGRDPAGWSEFYPCRWRRLQHILSSSPLTLPGVSRYVSRLPSASMVLSTLQKSLSTCCLSLRLYIRECRVWIFSVATSFYAFNIIKRDNWEIRTRLTN